MLLGRRGFLKALSVSPLAARAVAEKTALGLASAPPTSYTMRLADEVGTVDYTGSAPVSVGGSPLAGLTARQRRSIMRRAINIPKYRDELESALFASRRNVCAIDPDIAVIKSFSTMAKLTFQRQREVALEITQSVEGRGPWQQVEAWLERVAVNLLRL